MRQLLKIIGNLARLIAVIDIGKQISENLASKKATNNTKKETQPTDFSAIALSCCDPYRLDFITAHYINTNNSHLFLKRLQHSRCVSFCKQV